MHINGGQQKAHNLLISQYMYQSNPTMDHTMESALLDSFSFSCPATTGLGFWSSATCLGDDTAEDDDEDGDGEPTLRGLDGMCSLRSSLMGLLGLRSSGGGCICGGGCCICGCGGSAA